MEIPHDKLSPDVLRAVIEEFITREGTDYGMQEYSLEQKVEHVKRQLVDRRAVIVFNPEDETCSIVRC